MIRAILFDFYSVWLPDKFGTYLEAAKQNPEIYDLLGATLERYYQGEVDIAQATDAFRLRLNRPEITSELFQLRETDIPPDIINFMRNLHSHFIKLGMLGNLGKMELEFLNGFNQRNQLFELIASPLSLNLAMPLLSTDVFVAALNTIGEPPENCLVVTGNDDYIAFADSLGIATTKFEGLPNLSKRINDLFNNSFM
jgi:FMN phosphatase YigB (HAD superfamily)